jgi:hypothetical protein
VNFGSSHRPCIQCSGGSTNRSAMDHLLATIQGSISNRPREITASPRHRITTSRSILHPQSSPVPTASPLRGFTA